MTARAPRKKSDYSSREISDYSVFAEGDHEPGLNKKISTLISCESDYIVYLDESGSVQWAVTRTFVDPPCYGAIINRMGVLESLSEGTLLRWHRIPFERLLGEAVARALGEKDGDSANAILDKAEAYLNARMPETARIWYVFSTLFFAGIALLIGFVLFALRPKLVPVFGEPACAVATASTLGALGAFGSVASRTAQLPADAAAGLVTHCLEGLVRTTVGMVAAFITALALKSGFITFFHADDTPFRLLLLACMLAGASERIIPSLVSRFEAIAKEPEQG